MTPENPPAQTEVVAIGCIAADLAVLGAETTGGPGHTTFVDSIRPSLGGNPSNMAAGLARLGHRVAVAGRLGKDAFGQLVVERLKRFGVDTRLLQFDSAVATSTTIAMIHPSGERSLYHSPGTNAVVRAEDLEPALETPARLFFAGGIELMAQLRGAPIGQILKKARAAGMRTVLDTTFDPRGEWLPAIVHALPETDLLLTSMGEASHYAKTDSPGAVIRFFREHGARRVLLKAGGEGCYFEEEEGLCRILPPGVRVLDTTGAGDNFAAGLVAGILRNLPLPEAVRVGVVCGSLSTETPGGEPPYCGFESVREIARQLPITRE